MMSASPSEAPTEDSAAYDGGQARARGVFANATLIEPSHHEKRFCKGLAHRSEHPSGHTRVSLAQVRHFVAEEFCKCLITMVLCDHPPLACHYIF